MDRKKRSNGALVSVAAGVGSALGAAVGAVTGDWSWMPFILSACITLAGIGCLAGRAGLFFAERQYRRRSGQQ